MLSSGISRSLDSIFQVELLHRKRPTGDSDDWGVIKVLGKPLCVNRRTHQNDFEVGSSDEQVAENDQKKVRLDGSLMNLVNDKVGIFIQAVCRFQHAQNYSNRSVCQSSVWS